MAFDGVNFGSDQFGITPYLATNRDLVERSFQYFPQPRGCLEYSSSFYPSNSTKGYPSSTYLPDASPKPWSNSVDQFALATKLRDDLIRPDHSHRENFSSRPENHTCGCDACKKGTHSFDGNMMFYVLIFVLIVCLALVYSMNNQINHLKELFLINSRST